MCNTKDADNNTDQNLDKSPEKNDNQKDTDTNKDQNLDKTPENNDDQRVSVRFFKIILILTLLFAIVQIINCHLAKKRQDKICNLLYRTISIPNPLDTVFYSAMIIDSSVDKLDNLTIEKKLSIISSQNFHNRDEINYNQDIIRTIENVEKLLHLEFAKIQEERNSLTLWIGIITVVFLILSFYSMFKLEDLIKKGEDAVFKVDECRKEAKDGVRYIDENYSYYTKKLEDEHKKFQEKIDDLEYRYIAMSDEYFDKIKGKFEGKIKGLKITLNDMNEKIDILNKILEDKENEFDTEERNLNNNQSLDNNPLFKNNQENNDKLDDNEEED